MTSRNGTGSGGFGRRSFLKGGAAIGVLAGGFGAGLNIASADVPGVPNTIRSIRLMATDGYISLPGRRFGGLEGANELYAFGFRGVDDIDTETDDPVGTLVSKYKGNVHYTSPTIVGDEDDELALVVSNLGLIDRPDLDDSHSLHWHGFRNATAVFDGVPETSIAVPAGRDLPYYFDMKAARDTSGITGSTAGTYMYHCHFEDTEHVQMGMTGVIFIRPILDVGARTGPVDPISGNNTWQDGDQRYAYNDVSTAFDREFALLLHDIDTTPHDNLLAVQEFVWSDFEPNYFTINGRSYPDTVEPNTHPSFTSATNQLINQPNSALVQINAGEDGLLRLANLGFTVQSMEIAGITGTVVGADASYLGSRTYDTSTIDIGPGEARDILFKAPAFSGVGDASDINGPYDRYLFRSRNSHQNTNNGDPSLNGDVLVPGALPYGGMVTEIRVYAAGTLGTQTSPNETYPTYAA